MFSLFYQVLGNLGNRSVLISGSESTCPEVFLSIIRILKFSIT